MARPIGPIKTKTGQEVHYCYQCKRMQEGPGLECQFCAKSWGVGSFDVGEVNWLCRSCRNAHPDPYNAGRCCGDYVTLDGEPI